jgi:2-polyprenyl-6-methoxyphenol hydroxylase-like FAD-dependent oxidoreductase
MATLVFQETAKANLFPMTVRAEGANHAMQDGIELGKLLSTYENDIESVLRSYEQPMIERGRRAVLAARERTLDWSNATVKSAMVARFQGQPA